MDVKERLKEFHEKEGLSYKVIAESIGISTGVMYNYTSGIRELKTHVLEELDQYLRNRGY